MKKLVLLVALLGLGLGSAAGFHLWRQRVIRRAEEQAHRAAARLLRENRPAEALALIQRGRRPESRLDWLGLEIEAVAAQVNLPRIATLFSQHPERVLASEEASLAAARAFAFGRREADFKQVRQAWRGREQQPHRWLLLEADFESLGKRPAEAVRLLQSTRFPGTNDATRLLRLAILAANRNPAESWDLLGQAFDADPRNPDVRSFRGQMLEQLGRPGDARIEYVAALLAQPGNPLHRDQLAEFYRRRGDLDHALVTWREAMTNGAPDYFWLKTAFWSRVMTPAGAGAEPAVPKGSLEPLASLVRELPAGTFWDAERFGQLAAARQYQTERQEVFWLSLLEHLRHGREREALAVLHPNRFASTSWAPDLEAALIRVLGWRTSTNRVLTPSGVPVPPGLSPRDQLHPFLARLDQAAETERQQGFTPRLEPELTQVLQSRYALGAVFLAAGWREAALQLIPTDALPAEAPEWLVYGLAQALRLNRTPAAALGFLADRARTPVVELLYAELLLATGQSEAGTPRLEALAALDSDVGFRASWLLGVSALERKEPAQARHWVNTNPRLKDSSTGQELLARVALAEGRRAEALAIYRRVAGTSEEAMAVLARDAFNRKDWPEARRLTQQLIVRLPDELQLRANLDAIAAAERQP